MHPKTEKTQRRVHDAQFKAKVLAQCREPGVSLLALRGGHTCSAPQMGALQQPPSDPLAAARLDMGKLLAHPAGCGSPA
jgi:hypothetical protein